jgi:hypothetical protein
MAKCERCDLLAAEVDRTTKGRNDWFDRAAKAERELEKHLSEEGNEFAMVVHWKEKVAAVEKERDEWIAAYNAEVKKSYAPKVIWAEGKTPPPSLL